MVPSDTGVRQGCILSPLLFAIAIDWVMCRVMGRSDAGVSWMDEAKLADLDFADNIALLEESVYSMQHSTSVLEEEASRVGLCINPRVQGEGIQYVEWDSRHPLPGLYSGCGRRVLLFATCHRMATVKNMELFPEHIRSATNKHCFKRRLKTYYFSIHFIMP